jgi:hypothetical protein
MPCRTTASRAKKAGERLCSRWS